MTQFRFFLAPILSFFDFKLYREFAQEKASKGLLFQLYLAAVFILGLLGIAFLSLPKLDSLVSWFEKELPVFSFTSEGMKLEQPGPVHLTHPTWGKVFSFDDTKETLSIEDMGGATIFLTKSYVYFSDGKTMQSQALPKNPAPKEGEVARQSKIDGKLLAKVYHKLKIPGTVFAVFVFGVGAFFIRLLWTLLFSLIGNLIQLALPRGLSFEKLFLIACLASSVGTLISLLQFVPAIRPFFHAGLAGVLSFVYFVIGIVVQPKLVERAQD